MAISYACTDFLEFQEALKKMRDVDDKIIYTLNTSLPTQSFKGQVDAEATCRDLYTKLHASHKDREDAIKKCILLTAEDVKQLKDQREGNRDDRVLDKKFKAEQRKLRLLQSELTVEDIVRERSYKAFNERCRSYFKAGASAS